MKKLINGLRRKTTPTPPPTPITTNEPQEINYAILFDNDQDESSKENTHNNPPKKTTVVKKGGKPRRRKKRISKPTTIMNGGASRGMQTMMTISEIVEEGIEVDDLLAEHEHVNEVGVDETVIVVEHEDEVIDEGVSILESDKPEEDSDEISEDIVAEVPANLNDSGAIYSDSDSSEECVAEDDEELGESLIDLEEGVVGEEGVDNNNDIDEVNCEEVIVAPAIGESSTDDVIDESDHDSSEEIIAQEMNSAEEVAQQQQLQQHSHYSTNHTCQSPITNISKEDARHEYLKSIGLYTPSSFMQSLRLKYRVDLECHA